MPPPFSSLNISNVPIFRKKNHFRIIWSGLSKKPRRKVMTPYFNVSYPASIRVWLKFWKPARGKNCSNMLEFWCNLSKVLIKIWIMIGSTRSKWLAELEWFISNLARPNGLIVSKSNNSIRTCPPPKSPPNCKPIAIIRKILKNPPKKMLKINPNKIKSTTKMIWATFRISIWLI